MLNYFNGTVISTFFVLTAAQVLPVILALNLSESESVIVAFASSLKYFHRLPGVSE